MPTFHNGVGGKITAGAIDFAVADWQFTKTNRIIETTHSGTAGWAEFQPGVSEASGTANCMWDSTLVPDNNGLDPAGSTIAMKLYAGSSTKFYSFTAVIESIAVTSAIGDAVKFSVGFKASGVVTDPT